MNAHNKSAELHVPLKTKKIKRVPWENEKVIEKRAMLNEAHKRKKADPSQENNDKLELAKQNLDEAYTAERIVYTRKNRHASQCTCKPEVKTSLVDYKRDNRKKEN